MSLFRTLLFKTKNKKLSSLKFTSIGQTSTIELDNYGTNSPTVFKSNNNTSWELWDGRAITLNSGEAVYIRGENPNGFSTSTSNRSNFCIEGNVECEGNVMSLLGQDITDIPCEYCFCYLFSGVYNDIISAPELPATVLKSFCYYSMFAGCNKLTKAPSLPAIILKDCCYYSMFQNTGIIEIPELPATTLANRCYSYMFGYCKSIITIPKNALPVLALKDYCYQYMFRGCSSLVNAPELPATSLQNSCYSSMFSDCTSLTTASELPATTLASNCYSYMFDGCTSLINAPALPATTLARHCYHGMFKNCSSLVVAPKLPAIIISSESYSLMFYNCTALKEIYCNARYYLSGASTLSTFGIDWLYNTSSDADCVFHKNPEWAGPTTRNTSTIPSNWQIVDWIQ